MDLRRARLAVLIAFVVQGVCFAALVTRIPSLQSKFGLSDGQLGLLVGLGIVQISDVPRIIENLWTGSSGTGSGRI